MATSVSTAVARESHGNQRSLAQPIIIPMMADNQITASDLDDRVVYSVVGSSGKLTITEDPMHPAH
jgi:hypothetical protein